MQASTLIGHLALHYRDGDEHQARRLLELMGCKLVDNGPLPGADGFCTVLVDPDTGNHADNVMFLSRVPQQQAAIEDAIADALAIETDDESALVTALRAHAASNPESTSHIGFRYRTMEQLERILVDLERAAAPGGELEGRISVVKHCVRPGLDADVDRHMGASTVFAGVDKPSFADHWIQCFVNTDLCGFGILAFGSTFELDFVFDPFFDAPPSFGTPRKA